ncbi:hypothetical protein QQF64_016336 [Cirrhinus molitorella]|uniref:Uncharacterized protein n=1 Tax=Cirrhinus molitorella TaxID=172907 RepID=A0ABR3LMK7_9TELE
MWILVVIWIIFFVDGKTINECRLVLHAVASAVCQLYLMFLHLRHAAQHFAKVVWNILSDISFDRFDEKLSKASEKECIRYLFWYFRNAAVRNLEGVCLVLQSLSQFLVVVSTLCVAVRHVLQAALFLIVSTARWLQQMLLSKEDLNEWEKEQKKQDKELQKQCGQIENA